jgi:probable F420-dependent oxidoreductase
MTAATGRLRYCPVVREITFGVTLRGADSLDAFRGVVRRAEELGCDVIAAPDHLGALEPFSTLSAAAILSKRARLRTYVLNTGFWNLGLLARAAATLDVLSGGRLELGLGAGHKRSEYEDAGLPWVGHGARVKLLEATLIDVRRRLTTRNFQPRPVQPHIPIAVGAMTSAGLSLAAKYADIVAFSGLLQVPGARAGTFTVASAEQTAARVSEVRESADGRAYRSDALLQIIVIGEDPAAAGARLAAEFGAISAQELLDTPFVLLARDPTHAADLVAERNERFGFDSFITHEPNLEMLGQIISAYRR